MSWVSIYVLAWLWILEILDISPLTVFFFIFFLAVAWGTTVMESIDKDKKNKSKGETQ